MNDGTQGARVHVMATGESARRNGGSVANGFGSERETWRLIVSVTVPYWAYLAITRVIGFELMSAGWPGIIIAPAHIRLLQHLVLLPLLLVFYRWALAIGWPEKRRWKALAKHFALGLMFAVVARPVLVVLVAANQSEWSLLGELFDSVFGRGLSVQLWTSTSSDFLLSYVLGLALLLGVRNYRELKYQTLRAAHLQAEWTHSKLQALRMQLNPHFLFNTLNAAVALVSSKPQVAEQMLVRLADLLRRTLRDGESDFVTVEREAEFIRNYLDIQRLRFPDRLTYRIDIEPQTARALVPSLLLQPIAENAVVHGATADVDRVEIEVKVRRDGEWLDLRVSNTGIGLGNTRERLKTLFGTRQELALDQTADTRIVARVRIPFVEEAVSEVA
jgi:sensor histidine kinase YesM